MWTWLILAGILLAVEMMTGTLALLFAGLGALVAALLAYALPDSLTSQIGVFALATVVGTIVAWRRLKSQRTDQTAGSEAVGHEVQVLMVPDAMGKLRVHYRGSDWPARLADKDLAVREGDLLIVIAQEGSLLVVGPRHN